LAKNIQRSAQHKQQREEKRSQSTQELKAEIRTLRKQLTRLRKELTKSGPQIPDDDIVDVVDNQYMASGPKCKDCGSVKIKSMSLPTGTIFSVCKDCGKRQ
jgi:molecular chaperone GrpE (heat shock protein)